MRPVAYHQDVSVIRVNQFILKHILKRQTFLLFQTVENFYYNSILYLVTHRLNFIFMSLIRFCQQMRIL